MFDFPRAKQYQDKPGGVRPPINMVPIDMKFLITDSSFNKVVGFKGWMLVEIMGSKKKNIE